MSLSQEEIGNFQPIQWGEVMTYRVIYGDAFAMSGRERHLDDRVRVERFSTEHEALNRARELIAEDDSTAVAIGDTAGNLLLGGVRLQLKLGYACN
jgi:hypothetical protein